MVTKLGEHPPLSSRISPEIKKLFTDEAELNFYMKGVQAMDHGFGIGAAAYLRRTVESQWQLLVKTMRDAAEELAKPISACSMKLSRRRSSKTL